MLIIKNVINTRMPPMQCEVTKERIKHSKIECISTFKKVQELRARVDDAPHPSPNLKSQQKPCHMKQFCNDVENFRRKAAIIKE